MFKKWYECTSSHTMLTKLGSAPLLNKVSTTALCPNRLATFSGLQPFCIKEELNVHTCMHGPTMIRCSTGTKATKWQPQWLGISNKQSKCQFSLKKSHTKFSISSIHNIIVFYRACRHIPHYTVWHQHVPSVAAELLPHDPFSKQSTVLYVQTAPKIYLTIDKRIKTNCHLSCTFYLVLVVDVGHVLQQSLYCFRVSHCSSYPQGNWASALHERIHGKGVCIPT